MRNMATLGLLTVSLAAPGHAQEAAKKPDIGYWKETLSHRDPLDDTISTAIVLASADATKHPQRSSPKVVAALLTFMCYKKQPRFHFTVDKELVAGHSAKISYRLDDEPPVQRAKWSKSIDHTTVGLWGGPETLRMAERLASANKMFIRVEDNSFGTTEATFYVKGLPQAIKPVATACKWPPLEKAPDAKPKAASPPKPAN